MDRKEQEDPKTQTQSDGNFPPSCKTRVGSGENSDERSGRILETISSWPDIVGSIIFERDGTFINSTPPEWRDSLSRTILEKLYCDHTIARQEISVHLEEDCLLKLDSSLNLAGCVLIITDIGEACLLIGVKQSPGMLASLLLKVMGLKNLFREMSIL